MNINGSGIYKIINITNGKFYIGSARNFRNRWNSHKYHLIRNQHENSHLQNAWNKYGENQFKFEIIEECPINTLLMREQFYIDLYKPYDNTIGYNILRIAGSSLGFKFSEESRVKMSVAKQGKKLRLGAILSKETKEKISIANKGKIRTKETKGKISKGLTGIKRSPENNEKNRLRNIGRIVSEETRKKLRNRVYSEESRMKMSLSSKNMNIGTKNGMAKLSEKIVLNIRKDYKNGKTIKELIDIYQIKYQTIYKIIKRIRWNWLY